VTTKPEVCRCVFVPDVSGRRSSVEVDPTGGTPDEPEVFGVPMTDVSQIAELPG
jgi:hypothetical protein